MSDVAQTEKVKSPPTQTDGELSDAILTQLGMGKAKAITGKILAQRLGMRDTRTLRIVMAEMRQRGTPIIGGQKGYYLASELEEITAARQYLLSYIKDLCIDLRAYKQIAQRYAGQLSMRL